MRLILTFHDWNLKITLDIFLWSEVAISLGLVEKISPSLTYAVIPLHHGWTSCCIAWTRTSPSLECTLIWLVSWIGLLPALPSSINIAVLVCALIQLLIWLLDSGPILSKSLNHIAYSLSRASSTWCGPSWLSAATVALIGRTLLASILALLRLELLKILWSV